MSTGHKAKPENPGELLAAAKLIESVGAQIWMHLPDDIRRLSPEDLVEVVKDLDGWLAKQYGISAERIRAWRIYHEEDEQCTGTTAKGRRCLNKGPSFPKPVGFLPGESDRCECHVDVSR